MRVFESILWILVASIIAILFGILSHPASGQEMPAGVTYKDGTYYVKKGALKQFKRSQIRGYRQLAEEYKIKYKIIK